MGLTGSWDGRISRRTLLRTGGSAAAGLFLVGSTAPRAKAVPPFRGEPFSLGVASGEPTPDGVVLWTRLAQDPLDGGGIPGEVFGVRYEVAADEDFRRIVKRGAIEAVPEEAHSVHAEIHGLEPATEYWYRFKWGTEVSRTGRTRTAPPAGSSPDSFTFAFASCQNYTNGFYPAHADVARQHDVELMVWLGDYIYEGPGVSPLRVRDHTPAREIFSLDDYRTRHALYKTDAQLQAAHAALPWLITWDDHEFKDNYANLFILPEGQPLETVIARRSAAYQAFWEHQPLPRSMKPVGKDLLLYRRAQWGDLATFHVLDTRQYRDKQMADQCALAERDAAGYCPVQFDEKRTILGAEQRKWLFDGLKDGPAGGWNILANQVGFAPQDDNIRLDRKRFFVDPWDGYVADRRRVTAFLDDNDIANTVIITGDKHQHSVRNVPVDDRDFLSTPVSTEFVGTSISSFTAPATDLSKDPNNPHIFFEAFKCGWTRVELNRDVWQTEFRVMDTVTTDQGTGSSLPRWFVNRSKPGAHKV
jgi:alkaline phosphatase D